MAIRKSDESGTNEATTNTQFEWVGLFFYRCLLNVFI